jgi:hypothetical protein
LSKSGLSEHTAFKQCSKNEKIIRKINNKPPTAVTVAQLPLNSKKANYATPLHAF